MLILMSVNPQFMISLFQIIIFLLSAILHEYGHAWMALRLGDDTAERAGRLTLNPLVHLDMFGSLLLPGMLILTGSPVIFGYAKPVPINLNNLRGGLTGQAKVALAGPAANFFLAITAALAIRYLAGGLNSGWGGLLALVVVINLVLMIFNLLPIPPLDGSKILATILPESWRYPYLSTERWGFFVLLAIMLTWPQLLRYPINWLLGLLL
jgi:Zn-dependent protease